jgi:HEAT repeat protein
MAETNPPLERLLNDLHDPDTFVRSSAAREMGKLRDPRAVEALIQELHNPDWRARRNAAQALGASRAALAVEPLIAALKDRTMTVRARAAVALGRIKDARAIPALVAVLQSGDELDVDEGCFQALRKFGKVCAPAVTAALASAGSRQRLRLLILLADIPGAALIEPLAVLAEDPDQLVRVQAVQALAQVKNDPRALEVLLGALYDQSPFVRSTAAEAVAQFNDPRIAPALLEQLRDHELYGPRRDIYRAVTLAFRRMAGMPSENTGALSVSPVGWAGALASTGSTEPLKQFTGQFTDLFHKLTSQIDPQAQLPPQLRKIDDLLFTVRNAGSIAIAQVDALLKQLADPNPLVRIAAAVSLPWYGDARALAPLRSLISDPDENVRLAGAWAAASLEKFLAARDGLQHR